MKSVFSIVLLLFGTTATACSLCDSDTAIAIRASVFGPDFYYNLGASAIPFLIFLLITYLIHRGGLIRRQLDESINKHADYE